MSKATPDGEGGRDAADRERRPVSRSLNRRKLSLVMLAALVPSCGPPAAARRLKEQHPDARFEVRLTGCSMPGESARTFGVDARTALLWSRERVREARYFPCVALIRAIQSHRDTTAVYRLSITRDGSYEERALPSR